MSEGGSNRVRLLPMFVKDRNVRLSTFRISVARLLLFGFGFPPISMAYFIIKTMMTDFEGSNYTHCEVLNILPSLSSVARRQQYCWKIVTWLHFPFRLLAIYLYWFYYQRIFRPIQRPIGWLIEGLLLQESLSTVALTYLAHIRGDIHTIVACSIWISGCAFVGISFLSYKRYRRDPMEPYEKLSYLLKRRLFKIYFTTAATMWFWYLLHNKYCIPLAYSVFSMCEYIVTWCLMCYLWTSYLDFFSVYLSHNEQTGYFFTTI